MKTVAMCRSGSEKGNSDQKELHFKESDEKKALYEMIALVRRAPNAPPLNTQNFVETKRKTKLYCML